MKQRKLFAGARLKRLRRSLKLTQSRMAEELGVSASYLNLMERNQRPITAQVLIRLVEIYDLDIGVFSAEPEQRTFLALREAASDPVLASLGLDDHDLKELNEVHPLGAQAIVNLHKAHRNLTHTIAGLSEKVSGNVGFGGSTQRPEEIVRELVQENNNYFSEIEEAAEIFVSEISFDRRDAFRQLSARLQQLHSIRTRIMPQKIMRQYQRRLDQHSRRLLLSDLLSQQQTCFQMIVQIAHLELRDLFDEKCMHPLLLDAGIRTQNLYRDFLARYFAMAILLPYKQFVEQVDELQVDVLRLSAKFDTSIELIILRLASLRKPSSLGLPIFFLRIDQAGTIIERGGDKSFGFAQVGGNCPKWNVWNSWQNNPTPQADFVELGDGARLLSVAFATERQNPLSGQFTYSQTMVFGCASNRAMETIYGQKLGEARELSPTKIGANCQVCERQQCGQRSKPTYLFNTQSQNKPMKQLASNSYWSGEY
jgi:hypothetical protein